MGVYIKGVEMPKDCGKCFVGDRNICSSACPLIPVPPHGRLIDADELAATCDEPHWCAWLSDIDDAPTIIPAEPSKDDAPTGPYDLLYEEGGANTT